MPEASQEVDVECTCPKCGYKFIEYNVYVTVEFDMGDYAPDYP